MTKHTIILIISINLIMVQTIAARAYWNAVYQTIDNSFQDYCFETTGYYKTDSVKNGITTPELFKLYPNLLQRGDAVNILSSEAGNIRLMDIGGKVLRHYQFAKGTNQIHLMELTSSQLLLYDAVTITGTNYKGKIFVK